MQRFYLPPGIAVGRYALIRPIGAGGSGAVYEAFDGSLDRRVALKVRLVPDAHGSGRSTVTRFLREARTAAQLRHPNVVSVFDFGIDGDLAYLVMELVEGETLAQRLKREGALGVSSTLAIMLPILAAVAQLHAHGIVHRDIKPANILLAGQGTPEPKLADFGLSRFVDEPSSVTEPGVLLGTPGYTPPELMQFPYPASEASDQYALGVVLLECLTARSGRRGDVGRDVATGTDERSECRWDPPLPDDVDAILKRAMHHEPERRFASVDALAEALAIFAPESTAARWEDELAPVSLSAVDKKRSGATLLVHDGVAVALHGDVFTVLWKAPARMARVRWMFDVADRFASLFPRGSLALVIVLPSSSPPNYSTTMECIRRLRRLEASVRRQSTVAIGSGIWRAVVRSVHRAMNLPITSRAGSLTISGTIEQGVARLQEKRSSMSPSTAEMLQDVRMLYESLDVEGSELQV
jgi:serine/threonine protein kinase